VCVCVCTYVSRREFLCVCEYEGFFGRVCLLCGCERLCLYVCGRLLFLFVWVSAGVCACLVACELVCLYV
jgi:hypothetical protein